MKKRINIATIVDKMQRATRHLVELCSHNIRYSLLLAVANSSLFTLHSSLLMGCSSDDTDEPKTEKSSEVQLAGYVAGYEEVNRSNMTRAWTPPTGFSVFDTGEKSISVFFTQTPSTAGEERFFFKSSGKWKVSGEEIAAGTYYLYGYMPHDKSITSTVSVLTEEGKTAYQHGAVLTLTNVPTVSSADFCVMVGAINGYNNGYPALSEDYEITGLKRGSFQYVATGGESAKNYVFLLFDHLFSALRLQMRVQGDYNALRTIKLKELKLKTYKGTTATKKKTDVTITIEANGDGNDPITYVTFTPRGTETEAGSMFTSEAGFELNENYQEFTGHFMPQGVNKIILESTYDVYDKKGNLVRQGCTATNTLNLSMFSGQTEAKRGCRYTIDLTINPTYLYVMSDPDLDNPTVKVE